MIPDVMAALGQVQGKPRASGDDPPALTHRIIINK